MKETILTLASTVVLTSVAKAQTITNGSLTAPNGINSGLPSGWAQVSNTSDTINPANGTPFGGIYFATASPDGGSFVGSVANSSTILEGLQQTVTGLSIGTTYNISFYQILSNHVDFDTPGNWDVTFGGQTLTSANATSTTNWVQETLQFTATSASQNLIFERNYPGGRSYVGIDGITITPVPEPSSTALLGLGGLALLLRRKK